jgi:poly(3-hydroxybutyrate) depolymerase
MVRDTVRRAGEAIIAVGLLVVCAGCPQYRNWDVPGEIQQVKEPAQGGEYFRYVPTTYDAPKKWALIVVCHGTEWFDTAQRQIRDWVKLAEEREFLVIAPKLKGVNALALVSPEGQIELQREDEKRILACVAHMRGAYNIGDDRIFLTGWSAGGYAVLHTGLSNPDVFRAIAVLQGNFNPDYFSGVGREIDPYQPVYVLRGSSDVLTGKHGERCVDWLHEHRAAVTEHEVGGSHQNHPKLAYDFFERVARGVPWLHIRALPAEADEPMSVQFSTRSSFEPVRYQWSFGDGQESPIASPGHTYADKGTYTVSLDAEMANGTVARRAIELELPQVFQPSRPLSRR